MRALLPTLLACLAVPAPALAEGPKLRVRAAGPAVVGQTVDIVVEGRANGARLTFPDLRGELGTTACSLAARPGMRRFVLPYRPAWPGTHVVTVSVTSGACGGRQRLRWRPLVLEVAERPAQPRGPEAASTRTPPCARGAEPPRGRQTRAARLALLCLLNAERRARGLPGLAVRADLRRAASRKARRLRGPARAGEHALVGTGEHTAPARVLRAWLGADPNRADLLAPRVREVGVAVVAGRRGPMRRRAATWVLELR